MRPTPIIAALLVSLVAIAPRPAGAQVDRGVLRIASVSGDALGPGEAAALRGLISSYAVERGGFMVIDAEGRQLSLEDAQASPTASADYVLSANASRIGGRVALSLEVAKVATGEKKNVSESFSDLNLLVLASRRMTAALFDRAFGAGSAGTSPAPAQGTDSQAEQGFDPSPRLPAIAGTWDGDKGIDSISLRADGRGFALLDSGARMMLRAVISGSRVIIAQDQPNSPDFYRPDLDPKSARIVSAAARRWKWVFSLSLDGISLKGFKDSVFVKVDEKGAVSVDNDYSREALWTRRSR